MDIDTQLAHMIVSLWHQGVNLTTIAGAADVSVADVITVLRMYEVLS